MRPSLERQGPVPAWRWVVWWTALGRVPRPAFDLTVTIAVDLGARDEGPLVTTRMSEVRPAPRGVPQIEVTFDVDANGILNVSARDKDTGAEQQITISESSNLDRGEVERMVAEAQRNQAEDQRIRQQVDARNELDAVAYQVERQLAEGGDAIPSHERARAEMLVTDARQAIKDDQAPLERLRTLTGELQQALQGLMLAASGSGGGRPGGPSQPPPGGDDDVIDADFTPS